MISGQWNGEAGLAAGFRALKDHLGHLFDENIRVFREFRSAFGEDVAPSHDAALTSYTFYEALQIGRALEELEFIWFEEPIPDRQHENCVSCLRSSLPAPKR